MENPLRKYALLAVTLVAAGALAGCGNLSRGIAKNGSDAGQLVWPRPADAIALHRGGSFPNLDNLRQVQSGLTKNQIIALIGPPHFNEGFVGVREWNYLFNFRGDDGKLAQCEYKILFDGDKIARSFYWHPSACADFLKSPAAAAERFTLSADALFAFDQYALADIQPAGRTQLEALAKKLTAPQVQSAHIHVIGYTDRLGGAAYNRQLSERRAETVRDYLIGKGVSAARIDAEGRGEAGPVRVCDGANHAELVACLAPNRRVVVEAEGTR